jgi:hypothetical protein
LGCDENISRFQVAVHDEVLMRILHGGAHFAEQYDSLPNPKTAAPAIFVDRQAFDVLHDKIWLSIGSRTAIEQTRDIGMLETREDLPFLSEPIDNQIGFHALTDELDRHLFSKFRVGTHRQVNRSHTAGTELADEFVWSYTSAGLISGTLVFVQ